MWTATKDAESCFMDIIVQKVGDRDGRERFVLANAKTGEPIMLNDVSEPTMRRFLKSRGKSDEFLDTCFRKARSRFDKSHVHDEEDFDVFLEEIGLSEDAAGPG